ncbi:MAG TPA: RNA polymerase sigma factor [Bacteroidales bacterium]|nr:RNA polymerase sigma factor [Bacteroidales bacterium]HPT11250.1 RNA polymerase sigma factor [Bacteroidales bacterium]
MTSNEFSSSIISLKGNLQKYAMSLTLDRDNALDLVQDTYLKAIQNQDKFIDETNLKAWVFTIMKNTFINNYRRKIRENTMMDGTQELYYINLPSDKGTISPESSYAENEINKAVNSLESEYREPFRMHVEGFKYEEIADKLDLKLGTVKSRIFFARQKLMSVLKDYND